MFLPYLDKSMHIFIDSVPNNDNSKKYLDELIVNLNNSKIPDFFYTQNSKTDVWKSIQNILSSPQFREKSQKILNQSH